MKRKACVAVLILTFWGSVCGAGAAAAKGKTPSQVGGWSKARFGMTAAQVLTAFGGEATRVSPPSDFEDGKYLAPVEIRDTPVGPVKHARVSFIFPAGADHLDRVYVTESIVSPASRDDIRMRGEYDELEKLLTEKYGQPAHRTNENKNDGDIFEESATWITPSVVVELSYQHMTLFQKEMSAFLAVTYRKPMSTHEKDRL